MQRRIYALIKQQGGAITASDFRLIGDVREVELALERMMQKGKIIVDVTQTSVGSYKSYKKAIEK